MKTGISVVFLVAFPLLMFSQRPTDLELWMGGKMDIKLSKKFNMSISEQFRFDNTISDYKKSFTELGLNFEATRIIELNAKYRLIVLPGTEFFHRLSLDATFGFKKKKFPVSLKYRTRFQHQFVNTKTFWRNKVEVKYNMSKLVDPFVAYELFFRFNRKNEFRVSRFTAGLDWKITKQLGVSTFFRIEDDIFIKQPERAYIIGTVIKYKLN